LLQCEASCLMPFTCGQKASHKNYVDDFNRFNCSGLGGVSHNGY
jgi:hypothetical protein